MERSDGSPPIDRIADELTSVVRALRELRARAATSDVGVRLQLSIERIEAALFALHEQRLIGADGADLTGMARSVPVQDLFSFLATTRKTGIVRVETPSERFLVQLDDGAVVYAYGDRAPKGDGPADALLERGWVSGDALLALPDTAAQSAWLDPRLLETAHLSRTALQAALAHQTRCAFFRLCAVEDARYGFFAGARVQNVVRVHHSAVELLLEYHRLCDEAGRVPEEQQEPVPEPSEADRTLTEPPRPREEPAPAVELGLTVVTILPLPA